MVPALFFFSRPSIMHKKKPREHANGQTCVCGCSCFIYYWWVVRDSRVQLGFQVYYRIRRDACLCPFSLLPQNSVKSIDLLLIVL